MLSLGSPVGPLPKDPLPKDPLPKDPLLAGPFVVGPPTLARVVLAVSFALVVSKGIRVNRELANAKESWVDGPAAWCFNCLVAETLKRSLS